MNAGAPAAAASRLPRAAVTRSQLFFGLFLIATVNGFAGIAVRAAEQSGWARASANLFEISAILWVALAAGLKILSQDQAQEEWRRGDGLIATAALAAAIVPAATASAAALTLLSAWAILTSRSGSPLRRAAIIFLAVTGALIWGRILLAMFSRPLLDVDAMFVSLLAGAGHSGNMIWSEGTRLVVAPGCSSMQGISLAIVFWATLNQFFRVPFGWKAAAALFAAIAATVAVNVMRIGAMLRWPERLEDIHHGFGWHLANWSTLVLVVAICLYGARREVFGTR